jgi:hypothetical protein
MRPAIREQIQARLRPDDVVLDIGGWADPFERADWVIDLLPYESRGYYARRGWIEPRYQQERFTHDTWIVRDISDRHPFPFADDEIDFVVCAQTLEDVRDPIGVCAEIRRVGKAGYIEVPSRLEEQTWGVAGPYVGWPHHHWLSDVREDGIDFVFKPHDLHASPDLYFPAGFEQQLTEEERVNELWWHDTFAFAERVFTERAPAVDYLASFVRQEKLRRGSGDRESFPKRARRLLQRR